MKRIVALIGALLVLPTVASADSFSATFAGTGLGAGVKGSYAGGSFNVFAGQLKWDAGVDEFLSFCLQLDSPLENKQHFGTSMPDHISTEEAHKISLLVVQNFSGVTTKWMAAGLQLAIWNVLYDTDSYASTGTFSSTTSEATYWADKFLGGLNGSSASGKAVFLNSYPGTTGQDQVTFRVSEPGTMLLLGLGALVVAARRRKSQAN